MSNIQREKVIGLMYQRICKHNNCSDSNDNQYPDCEEQQNGRICPAVGFNIENLTDEIIDIIKLNENKIDLFNCKKCGTKYEEEGVGHGKTIKYCPKCKPPTLAEKLFTCNPSREKYA